MKIFYIDTSSSYLYSGIVEGDILLSSCKINFNKDLSKYALSEVEKLFLKANIEPNEIDKIIVVSGPGSFTGIRIGMTIAKIFAWSLKKQITMISSLEAMASSIETDKLIVPIIDARRGFVYAGVYDKDNILLENQYIKFDELINYLSKLNREYVYVVEEEKTIFDKKVKYDPDILKIVKKYKNKKNVHPHLVEPTYLKLTEAEENLGTHHDN